VFAHPGYFITGVCVCVPLVYFG